MKRIIVLAFVAISFAACKKEDAFQENIVGTWQLERRFSMEPPAFNPPLPQETFTLNANGTYQVKRNDTLLKGGTYSIDYSEDCSKQKQYFFRAEGYDSHVLSLEGDKLLLFTSNCLIDGGGSLYRRKP